MKTFPLVLTIFSAAQLLFLCNSIVAGTESVCDSEAVEQCTKQHKQGCEELGPSECGNCLDGYGKVSSICVDTSQCEASQTPSKMVLLLDGSASLGRTNFEKQKDLARDLIGVFPVNEFAIRTFATEIVSYPSAGGFVGKEEALNIIPDIAFDNGATFTGEAIKETVKLLKDERDSFNIVIVFTDGKASDGLCPAGLKCDPDLGRYSSRNRCKDFQGENVGYHTCSLEVQAPKLKALADRNQTVTVVSVGFGNVDLKELEFIASSKENVIMAQGDNAAEGLKKLQNLLDKLVKKVCSNLPRDCVVEYGEWSACDAPCGEQNQRRRVKRILKEARKGGKPCPAGKALTKTYYRLCPQKPECPPSTTAIATTAAAATTTGTTNAAITTTASPIATTNAAITTTIGSAITSSANAATPSTTKSAGTTGNGERVVDGNVVGDQVVDGGTVYGVLSTFVMLVACCGSMFV